MKKAHRIISWGLTIIFIFGLAYNPGGKVQAISTTFTPGNIVVYRVGDGLAGLTASGSPVFLDEYTPAGVLVRSIPLPTATSGSNRMLVASGTATSEGLITRSTDGQYLVMTGYDAAVGTASLPTTTSTSVNRVIGLVDWKSSINTTTALTNAISGGNPRGAASTNGTDLWISGTSTGGGIHYTTLGSTTSTSLGGSGSPTNLRATAIYDNQLYVSTSSGSAFRIGTVGTGTPTTAGQAITSIPGFPTSSGGPYAFFFADLSPTVSGDDTLYVADNSLAQILKYSLISGTWTSNGTIAAASVVGLTASVSGTTVTLFGTYSGGSKLFSVVDTAGYNVAPSTTTLTDLATAMVNTAFRGVALAPVQALPDLTVSISGPANSATGVAYDYTLIVSNTGTVNATHITVQFTLPGGVTYNNSGVSNGFTANQAGGIVTFSDGIINAGTSATLTVNVTSSFPGTITVSPGDAIADPSNDIIESNESNNSSTQTVTTIVASSTPPTGIGAAIPATVGVTEQSLLTMTVTPGTNPTSTGLGVTCDLTTIGGSATQTFYDDATNGDITLGDNIFSYQATIGIGSIVGGKTFNCTLSDSEARSTSPTISLNVAAATNPSGIGTANPTSVLQGYSSLLTVAVTPGSYPTSTGLDVTCNLTSIGGSATQVFFDDGTNGDVAAGDNTFSFSTTIDETTTPGAKSLTCTIGDAESRPGSASIALTVTAILPIGTVNGPVGDTDNGTTHTSPYVGQTVTIQGLIYEKTLQAISNSANTYKGFFIQNTSETADADANTSDGMFVFMSTASTMSGIEGTYTPAVGDEIILSGKVSEYYNMTELVSPFSVIDVVRKYVNLNSEIPPVVANPPVNLADANRYWERLQSMRTQVPLDSIVLGGRNVFSPADAEIWVARPDSTIAGKTDPYARRSFRDAHPLDDNYNATNWDGNGYRILMGSLGIKATAGDAQTLIDPARTFDTLTNAPIGGVNYTFSKYRIEITDQPTFSDGVDPAANNPPQTFDRSFNYSIVDYNLENLYDYRNNPFSGCDFVGDSGCSKTGTPFLADVYSPFDYVPASDAAYQARLNDIALQIINDLHNPDILMVQEVENQDICSVISGTFTCSTTDGTYTDRKPDVLQELALKVASLGGATYDAAWDPNSSDLRGIAPAYMYRTDRVELLPAAGDPILGSAPAIVYPGAGVAANADVSNPKTLNAVLPSGFTGACETSWVFPRAPDIGLFRIYSTSIGVGNYRDVYVINNHFKSTPDSCVAHRTEQAKYNAAIVTFLQGAKPNARIVVGGDLNVYPRPDDIAYGASDQLGSLYDPSLGLTNLWDVLLSQAPEAAYSYVYLGMAQTLDQMFVNAPMLADLNQFRIAHINSDFPADYPTDVARGTSDHDPNVATFTLLYRYYFPLVGR